MCLRIEESYTNLINKRCGFETHENYHEKAFHTFSEFDKNRPDSENDFQETSIIIDNEKIEALEESINKDGKPWRDVWKEWEKE